MKSTAKKIDFTCIYVINTIQNVLEGLGTESCPQNITIITGTIEIKLKLLLTAL